MAGIDVRGVDQERLSPLAWQWSGVFNGVSFKDVTALRMDVGGPYSMVQAEAHQ
jgi:hypothetical protein